jgi:hypothetical protein
LKITRKNKSLPENVVLFTKEAQDNRTETFQISSITNDSKPKSKCKRDTSLVARNISLTKNTLTISSESIINNFTINTANKTINSIPQLIIKSLPTDAIDSTKTVVKINSRLTIKFNYQNVGKENKSSKTTAVACGKTKTGIVSGKESATVTKSDISKSSDVESNNFDLIKSISKKFYHTGLQNLKRMNWNILIGNKGTSIVNEND